MNNNNLYQALEKYAADYAVTLDTTDDSDVRFSWRYKRKRKRDYKPSGKKRGTFTKAFRCGSGKRKTS